MKRTAVIRWVAGVATVLSPWSRHVDREWRPTGGFTIHIGVVVPSPGRRRSSDRHTPRRPDAVQQAKAALKQAGVNDVKIEIEYADDGTTPEAG
jgi:hypothetical protein